MAAKKKIMSEHTKDLEPRDLKELQGQIKKMTPEELKTFRNGFDPDSMGFHGEESI